MKFNLVLISKLDYDSPAKKKYTYICCFHLEWSDFAKSSPLCCFKDYNVTALRLKRLFNNESVFFDYPEDFPRKTVVSRENFILLISVLVSSELMSTRWQHPDRIGNGRPDEENVAGRISFGRTRSFQLLLTWQGTRTAVPAPVTPGPMISGH